jgi:hypothetical protein
LWQSDFRVLWSALFHWLLKTLRLSPIIIDVDRAANLIPLLPQCSSVSSVVKGLSPRLRGEILILVAAWLRCVLRG